jgi:hypothetical protein
MLQRRAGASGARRRRGEEDEEIDAMEGVQKLTEGMKEQTAM